MPAMSMTSASAVREPADQQRGAQAAAKRSLGSRRGEVAGEGDDARHAERRRRRGASARRRRDRTIESSSKCTFAPRAARPRARLDGFCPHRSPEPPRQDDARPGPHHRRQRAGHAARSAHGAARGRRRAAGGARLHRPRQGQGARRRGRRLAVAGPGAGRHRQPRARRDDGRRRRRHQPRGAAAGRDPDGRPAGRRQDDDHRQARQAPDREAQEEGADGLGRRLPPGRDRAAEDGDAAGRRRMVPVEPRPTSRSRSPRAALDYAQAPLLRRAAGRHRRPPGDRRER